MKNNQKPNSNDLDFFKPIQEIFHEVLMMLFDVTKELSIFLWTKYMNGNPPLKKIEMKTLQVKKTTNRENALGLDTKTKQDLLFSEIDFRRHSFIVGASGFGKTNLMSILQENSLKLNKPIIFFDPKGDLGALNTFKRICSMQKKPCYIFSEHYPDSISLNPVLEGTVNQVTDRIMRAFEWSEPYYRDASRRSLTKALNNLKNEGQDFSLKRIFDQLTQMETKDNIGLISKIEAILESDFGKILNADSSGLTMSKIREERASLYIGLSTQGYGETAMAVGKLFLGELLYNSYKSLVSGTDGEDGLKNPISVYFDEFGSLVTPEFIELQNKCRGAGIELTLAVQTASDIDRVNPELTKQIIENAANLFILKQRLDASVSLFADAIGTTLSKKETYTMEDGKELSKGSIREANELIVHPDIIKNLKIGQCVLLRQGPTRVNVVNIRDRQHELIKRHNEARRIVNRGL